MGQLSALSFAFHSRVRFPPPYPKGFSATRIAFAGFEPGWGAQDDKYHPAPAPQYVIYVGGQMSVTTSDGQSRQFRAGDVLRVEDVAPCKGHIRVAGATSVHTIVVRCQQARLPVLRGKYK